MKGNIEEFIKFREEMNKKILESDNIIIKRAVTLLLDTE